jgi:DMSO/TMAO reductase YedYZ heme-binding membrane subunit
MTRDPDKLPPDRLLQPVTMKWFAAIFGTSLAYSIVRYHFVGDTPWTHFPLFILNKATSLAAVGFVASSYLIGKIFRWHDHNKHLRLVVIKFCGIFGFFLAGIHAFLSLCLLRPAYFEKFFLEDGQLNFTAELSMTVGVIGLFLLMSPAISTLPMLPKAIGGWRWKRSQRVGYLALAFVVIHLVVMGYKGWMTPSKWPGGLLPISLVAVIVALLPLIVRRKLERQRQARLKERKTEADSATAEAGEEG